ncbi:hypothetical protein N9812_00095 [bacterium]|nr:hypothetical protein [bacterium]
MTLSRWRRVATGVAAGVIVLCAALFGASFRNDNAGVSVASELLPANIIPIEEDPTELDTGDTDTDTADSTPSVDADGSVDAEGAESDSVQVIEPDDIPDADDPAAAADGAEEDPADATPSIDATTDDGDSTADEADDEPAPTATTEPPAPLTAADDSLGTGGGVDDAQCALDRLVIYAGARVGGVAGSIRAALTQAGFGAGCPAPVTILASNCPLQFTGVLGTDSGYDPATSFVAASASVDRETMTVVIGSIGYTGTEINILDFSFVNPDTPDEQWMAIFVPPSFAGWEGLASRAGLSPSTASLCAPSGELAG